MTINYRKIVSMLLVVCVAVVTGFSIGKIFLDSTTLSTQAVTETEEELRESDSVIAALVEASKNGKTDFSGVELYQIAEYNLNNSSMFLREMLGNVNASGEDVPLKSQKFKEEGNLTFYKFSPTKKVAGGLVSTPNICIRVVSDLTKKDQIKIAFGQPSNFVDTSSSVALDADLSGVADKNYTAQSYKTDFNTTPKTSVLPYIISSKTCDAQSASAVTRGEDGSYSFTITLSGDNLNKAALYYTYEILQTCGYGNPSLSWSDVTMNVTVDKDFRFTKIHYVENYTIASPDIPVLKKSPVTDTFDDSYYYELEDILSRANTDYLNVRGRF